MEALTIAYITNRKDCRIEWFYEAILRQSNGNPPKIIVVDFWKEERDITQGIWRRISQETKHVEPKPNVWNGKHRLTKENWFAASSTRNTALCLCDTSHIAYIDDLSVPVDGWLAFAYQAITQSPKVYLGSYKKVKNLVVENGVPISYDEYPGGRDSRWYFGSDTGPVNCSGEYLYGCSLIAPVDMLLAVGGWPEYADGLSFEDVLLGLALEGCKYKFAYCRQLLTLESEELHHAEPPFIRRDKGVSPNDKSHAALNIVKNGTRYFENYYEGGIRRMREQVLSGQPFPIQQNPKHDWYDSQPLSEM